MSFQDVVLLPSSASFSTTFLKNCGRSEGLGTTTSLGTVVMRNQGLAPCEILLLQQSLFFSVKFHGDHMAVALGK